MVLKNKNIRVRLYLLAGERTSNHDQSLTQTTTEDKPHSSLSIDLTSSQTLTTENLKTKENTSEEKAQPILVIRLTIHRSSTSCGSLSQMPLPDVVVGGCSVVGHRWSKKEEKERYEEVTLHRLHPPVCQDLPHSDNEHDL